MTSDAATKAPTQRSMNCPLCQSSNPADAQRCRSCGATLRTSSSENNANMSDALPAGTLLAGAYMVEGVLGQGGFGITYRCHDQMLDRRVAVKEFFPSRCRRHNAEVAPSRGLSDADYREARAQFLAEARTLARCHHIGIVGVHAAFEANQTAYMVMELLHGKSLAQLLTARGGRMNEAEAVAIIERVGEALQFVHEQNLLHRDIKPDNIIACDDGRVMLIDFGTARETIQDQVQGQTVIVTPGYAPLEQYARQAKRGAFTDIYSLAATLYHLLTGQMPPAASDRAMGVQLRPVREFNPNIGASVARATQSALQMEIARRPQSVREFLDLLHAPVEDAELESDFASQTQSGRAIEANPDFAPEMFPLPDSVFSGALRARQELADGALPLVPRQPLQLAPSRDFVANADAYEPTQISVAGGNVNFQRPHGDDASTKKLERLFAGVIVFSVLVVLYGSMGQLGQQRAATPPDTQPVGQSPSFAESSSHFNSSQEKLKRQTAQQNWDALPALLPASVQILPDSKKTDAQSNAQWRGAVQFSPDGKRLAYVDKQCVLRVLSLPDRKLVRALALDPKQSWNYPTFSTDNQTIAVSKMVTTSESGGFSYVNGIEVWSVRTGQLLGTFAAGAPNNYVWTQAVLNDGQLLLRTGEVGEQGSSQLFLWDAKTGKRSKSPIAAPKTANWGYGVAAPDGKEFVLGDASGRLSWLDFKTGKQRHQQTTQTTWGDYQRRFGYKPSGDANATLGVRGIDYSLNGSTLASRNDAEVRVFDANANEIGVLPIDAQSSMFFSVSPDGKWVAAEGTLPYAPRGDLLWNVKTGQKIRLESSSNILLDFGFSSDGKELYGIFSAGDRQFQMVTWNVNAKPPSIFAKVSDVEVQFSSVNKGLHTPSAQTDKLFALPTESSIEVRSRSGAYPKILFLGEQKITGLEFSPDGRFLAARKPDGGVQLWDVQAQKLMFQSEVSSSENQTGSVLSIVAKNLSEIAISSDNRLWAYARPNGASTVVELRTLEATPRLLASFPQQGLITALKFSPDNKSLVCGGEKGLLQWFDVATRQLRDSVEAGESTYDIAFGARNLVVMGEKTTWVYQVPANSNQPLQSAKRSKLPSDFDWGRDIYSHLVISPDGKLLAVQDQDSVQVWDLATKTKLQDLLRDDSGATKIYSLKFSADSNQLSAIVQEVDKRRIIVKNWSLTK